MSNHRNERIVAMLLTATEPTRARRRRPRVGTRPGSSIEARTLARLRSGAYWARLEPSAPARVELPDALPSESELLDALDRAQNVPGTGVGVVADRVVPHDSALKAPDTNR